MKASQRQQGILLKLQDQDTLIARLRRTRAQIPVRAELQGLQGELSSAKQSFMAVQRVIDTQQAEISRLESDTTMVRERRIRDTELLAGNVSAREAQALQTELDMLTARQNALEERELELLEAVESHQAEYQEAQNVLDGVESRRADLTAEVERHERLIDADLKAAQEERAGLAAELQRDLLDLYEELRQRIGIGAARLRGNVSEASNMTLAPAELQDIHATASDEIVFCPGTGAILVRQQEA